MNGVVYQPSGYPSGGAGSATLYEVPVDKPAGTPIVKLGVPIAGQGRNGVGFEMAIS